MKAYVVEFDIKRGGKQTGLKLKLYCGSKEEARKDVEELFRIMAGGDDAPHMFHTKVSVLKDDNVDYGIFLFSNDDTPVRMIGHRLVL